jgi:hypothetical protein
MKFHAFKKMALSDFVQEQWVKVLCKSLRMTYITASGRPPQRWEQVIAHPEFDPEVVRAMDRKLGKALGDRVYAIAFRRAKPRADAMLAAFEAVQIATNRPFFNNCLARVLAVYKSHELVDLLKRPKNLTC